MTSAPRRARSRRRRAPFVSLTFTCPPPPPSRTTPSRPARRLHPPLVRSLSFLQRRWRLRRLELTLRFCSSLLFRPPSSSALLPNLLPSHSSKHLRTAPKDERLLPTQVADYSADFDGGRGRGRLKALVRHAGRAGSLIVFLPPVHPFSHTLSRTCYRYIPSARLIQTSSTSPWSTFGPGPRYFHKPPPSSLLMARTKVKFSRRLLSSAVSSNDLFDCIPYTHLASRTLAHSALHFYAL